MIGFNHLPGVLTILYLFEAVLKEFCLLYVTLVSFILAEEINNNFDN